MYVIWGDKYTPSTIGGDWPFPLLSLWLIHPQSFTQMQYSALYYLHLLDLTPVLAFDPSRDLHVLHFLFLCLGPFSPLTPAPLCICNIPQQFILYILPFLWWRGCIIFSLKTASWACQLYWLDSLNHSHEQLVFAPVTCWLNFWFNLSRLFLDLHCRVPYQKKPLVSLISGLCWYYCMYLN